MSNVFPFAPRAQEPPLPPLRDFGEVDGTRIAIYPAGTPEHPFALSLCIGIAGQRHEFARTGWANSFDHAMSDAANICSCIMSALCLQIAFKIMGPDRA